MTEPTSEPIHDPQRLEQLMVIRENAGDIDGMTALFEPDAVIVDKLRDLRLPWRRQRR